MLNDVPVEPIVRRTGQTFPFELGFNAGALRIALVRGRNLIAAQEVEVDPALAKITRDEYAALIGELANSTLALYRLGGLTVPAEVDPGAVRADLVTLDLVRTNFDGFERAVRRVAEQPTRRLDTSRRRIDILKARRIDDRDVSRALRTGNSRVATALEARAAPKLVGALAGNWISAVDESHRAERFDVYENKALLGFMRWLSGTLEVVRARLAAGDSDMLPAVAAVWSGRALDWMRRLRALARRDVFAGMTPDPTLRATSVFRLHPDYAAVFSAMVRMKAGLGTGAAVAPSVPIDRTFALYESWCYVGFLNAAAQRFPPCREQIARLLKGIAKPNHLGVVLARGGASSIDLGGGFSLTYQRPFGKTPDASGCWTPTIEAVPDIVISRVGADGQCEGLFVFDPKYRGGASLLDGLRDLHVYRDAIRGPAGDRVVLNAIAIAPRPFTVGSDLWRGPVGPGTAAARPGHDPEVFHNLLNQALEALA